MKIDQLQILSEVREYFHPSDTDKIPTVNIITMANSSHHEKYSIEGKDIFIKEQIFNSPHSIPISLAMQGNNEIDKTKDITAEFNQVPPTDKVQTLRDENVVIPNYSCKKQNERQNSVYIPLNSSVPKKISVKNSCSLIIGVVLLFFVGYCIHSESQMDKPQLCDILDWSQLKTLKLSLILTI